MPIAEPTLAALPNPLLRYFLATRPPFLAVTLFAALLGLASAAHAGVALSAGAAALTVVFALVAHAGVNVLNDYYDDLNGTDRINDERVFPFTGGSRFIQNGVLTRAQTAGFGAALFLATIAGGLWLAQRSGPGLLAIGAAGLAIGWAYSAPPLKLNSRGFGEPCVAAGFLLIALGADYVQRRAFDSAPLSAALCYALLVTNILYINQFPDRKADQAAGKHHWVVRLGAERARWGYAAIALLAYGALAALAASGALPLTALAGLLASPLSLSAAATLQANASRPQALAPAIKLTIAAACLNGALVSLGLLLA
jgi:1,4-dihydroxy-2-naphthoate octaprenyltransferase